MTVAIHSTVDQWLTLTDHLRDRPERVAFAVGAEADSPDAVVLREVLLVEDDQLEPGPWCVQLTEDAAREVLAWATQCDGWLVEIHSHLGRSADPVRFSGTDVDGLAEWVPHVRWRLKRRPYGALVLGPETLDGIAWTGAPGEPPAQISSWVTAHNTIESTCLSLDHFTGDFR